MKRKGLRRDRFRLGFSAAVLRLQKTQPKDRRKKCPSVDPSASFLAGNSSRSVMTMMKAYFFIIVVLLEEWRLQRLSFISKQQIPIWMKKDYWVTKAFFFISGQIILKAED